MPVVVRARADLAEPDVRALDEQLDAEQALAAEVVGDGLGNALGARERRRIHAHRLPALHVVALDLHMADGRAEAGLHRAVGAERAHGQQCDLVVEVDEAFDYHAAVAHAAAGHRVVPRRLRVGRPVDLALALAGAAHHGLDDARVADGGLAAGTVDGGLQLFERVAEHVRAGGQGQRLGGEAADAFAVHRQARGTRGGNHADDALGLQRLQLVRGQRLDLRHHQVGLLALDQRAQRHGIAHRDRVRVVGHLLARRVLVAVDGDGLDAQALQRDQHFLAELAAAQQHHTGGGRTQGRAEGLVVGGHDGLDRVGEGRIRL